MRPALAAALVVAGCVEDPIPIGPETVSKVEIKEIPLPVMESYDILVVLDRTPSMRGEQATLASNARVWMDVLSQIEGGLPDLHLAVVDSDVGTMGVDVGDPRCSGAGSDGRMSTFACGIDGDFIAQEIDEYGGIHVNYSGTLQDAFTCVATSVGAAGCPWRQPLEAMRRALHRGKANGFLRDHAQLAVIFVGDADDCSAADPALFAPSSAGDGARDPFRCFAHGVVCDGVDDPYAPGPRAGCQPRNDGYLRTIESYRAEVMALKEDPRYILVAGVTPGADIVVEPGGQLADGCTSGDIAGTPAIRLRAFLEGFPDRYTYTTICDTDWSDALIQFAELLTVHLGAICVNGQPVDLDPTIPGLQPDIAAAIIPSPMEPGTTITACGDDLPCYRLELTNECAFTPSRIGVKLEPPLFRVPSYLMMQIAVR